VGKKLIYNSQPFVKKPQVAGGDFF